jgi:hypothetical protein
MRVSSHGCGSRLLRCMQAIYWLVYGEIGGCALYESQRVTARAAAYAHSRIIENANYGEMA